MAPIGVALLALATRQAPAWQGALLGLVSGLACFLPSLSWSGIYVGELPWVALAVLESLYMALLGLACAVLQRGPSLAGVGRARPAVVALAWVAQEALRGATPFGGFPWGRLAFSQADSPLAGLAALGGAPAVTFGVALAGGLLAAGVAPLVRGSRQRGVLGGGVPGGGIPRRILSAAPPSSAPSPSWCCHR
jgi:apolipoprotein N-acyltransferase